MKVLWLNTLFILTILIISCEKTPKGVFFENLIDGQEVNTTFTVKMQVKGMEIKPAGEIIKGTGHHHIIVDGQSIKLGEVVPTDSTHLHFGKGQTEATLKLTPGKHTLTLQFANGAHQSYGEIWSKAITIKVK